MTDLVCALALARLRFTELAVPKAFAITQPPSVRFRLCWQRLIAQAAMPLLVLHIPAYSHGSIRLGNKGLSADWRMRLERKSPCYTTS